MDYDRLKLQSAELRSKILLEELDTQKRKVISKYNLQCNSDLYWERPTGRYPMHVFFSHKFMKKSSMIRIIFHIYRLCFAKIKYFESNWDDFVPCIHDWRNGFVECELYNMEFIKHKYSDIIFDLRDLSRVTDIKDFMAICDHLYEQKRIKMGLEYYI